MVGASFFACTSLRLVSGEARVFGVTLAVVSKIFGLEAPKPKKPPAPALEPRKYL